MISSGKIYSRYLCCKILKLFLRNSILFLNYIYYSSHSVENIGISYYNGARFFQYFFLSVLDGKKICTESEFCLDCNNSDNLHTGSPWNSSSKDRMTLRLLINFFKWFWRNNTRNNNHCICNETHFLEMSHRRIYFQRQTASILGKSLCTIKTDVFKLVLAPTSMAVACGARCT